MKSPFGPVQAGLINPSLEFTVTPKKAAELLGVHPKTLARWADKGIFPCLYTDGGHRRYPIIAIHEIVQKKHLHLVRKYSD